MYSDSWKEYKERVEADLEAVSEGKTEYSKLEKAIMDAAFMAGYQAGLKAVFELYGNAGQMTETASE